MPRNTRIIHHDMHHAPLRHLRWLATSICLLLTLFQSSPVDGQVIVANNVDFECCTGTGGGRITVFDRHDVGDVAPQRIIEGDATGMYAPFSVAVDLENKELFVLNNGILEVPGSVTVYNLDDNGNVSPKRTLHHTSGLGNPEGFAVDPVNDELYIHEDFGLIYVFDRAASGSATPLRTLDWSDGQGLQGDVALDLVNDELFTTNEGRILVFPRTASGDDQPIRVISGANTGVPYNARLVVDPRRDEIIVGGDSSIRVFSRIADGNVHPLRVIEGPTTGLSNIHGVALDQSSRTIFVTDRSDNAVLAFPQLAEGDVTPIRKITGIETRLEDPLEVVVSGFVFEDGFESGDPSGWSTAHP